MVICTEGDSCGKHWDRFYSELFCELRPEEIQRAYRQLFELYQEALKNKRFYQKKYHVSGDDTRISCAGVVDLSLVGYQGKPTPHDGKDTFRKAMGAERGYSFYEITADALLDWDQKPRPGEMTLTVDCRRAVQSMRSTPRGLKLERVFGELRFQNADQDPHPDQLERVGECIIFSGETNSLKKTRVKEQNLLRYYSFWFGRI